MCVIEGKEPVCFDFRLESQFQCQIAIIRINLRRCPLLVATSSFLFVLLPHFLAVLNRLSLHRHTFALHPQIFRVHVLLLPQLMLAPLLLDHLNRLFESLTSTAWNVEVS